MASNTTSFDERIGRIKRARRTQDGKVLIHVGDSSGLVRGAVPASGSTGRRRSSQPGQAVSFCRAITLGLLGGIWVGMARNQILSYDPLNPDMIHAATGTGFVLVVAFLLASVLVHLLRPRMRKLALGQLLGIALAVLGLAEPGVLQSQAGTSANFASLQATFDAAVSAISNTARLTNS